jgi:CRISPR/Cas system-associated exonuclease Cas4 (RecB family)
MLRVATSTSAAARLFAAAEFLGRYPPATEVVIVGASRGAADDFARSIARSRGATFGLARFSLTELAARAAAVRLGGLRHAPGTRTGSEATAAHAVFEALAAEELDYFCPVAALPGFPRALARTIHELRLAEIRSAQLSSPSSAPDAACRDIGLLLARVEEELTRAGVDDRAQLLHLAAEACALGLFRWAGHPLVLLDVPLDSRAERRFVSELLARAPEALATLPDGDQFARNALTALSPDIDVLPDAAPPDSDLSSLRRYVFVADRPPVRARAGDVRLFSAPGEGREAAEIVRRVLDEAARGVPFDEMAVFLRAPQHYLGLLEHACDRGGVPTCFDRGTTRPDPSGRAFIALLSCAAEGLSAKRFDEYLSLGQVPQIVRGQAPPRSPRREPVMPRGEEFPELDVNEEERNQPEDLLLTAAGPDEPAIDSNEEAVVAGTLRSPWKWEELVIESAIVGGRNREEGKKRWRRRLEGLAADYRYRIAELEREEPDSPSVARYARDLRNLAHLQAFALPLIDLLASWPDRAHWGEWLGHFAVLAERALKQPVRVLETLAELRPMAAVGPVTLTGARDVLQARLVSLEREPPMRRYGRLFVGTPHQARGRTFRVVFVPGLAERIVPQRPREDPLLLDERRRGIDLSLMGQDERAGAERLLLKIAIGAASERLYLSYPRLDVAESRARVPSFYALDVVRAMTGEVPDHRALAADAADESGARLAWPAPAEPDRAIDDLEHDLATLKPLLESRDPASVKGRAHYLLGLNEALHRSVISRWARAKSNWSASDGLIRVTPGIAPAIDRHRLGRRPYSLSALQRFSVCPYQFLLAAIHRLEPWDEPEPLLRMDPLTRGSLFHRVQTEFYRALQSGDESVTSQSVSSAVRTLEDVLDRVAAEYADELVPAIERVWRDEIQDLRRDLTIWVQRLADERVWEPRYFEFSFGLHDKGRDPRSLADPVLVDGRFLLRGSIDLIEQHAGSDLLRVTDHKTGKNRSTENLMVGRGSVLQPVLYSVVVEEGLGRKVAAGRLYYCTTAGGFTEHQIAVTDESRRQGLEVLTIVDRAVERGFLPAAPDTGACGWCDFRPVCGPREEERTSWKSRDGLADLSALRMMP